MSIVDAGGGMASDNNLEGGLEIGVWLYAVEFAGLDPRRDTAPGSTAFNQTKRPKRTGPN